MTVKELREIVTKPGWYEVTLTNGAIIIAPMHLTIDGDRLYANAALNSITFISPKEITEVTVHVREG